MAELSVSCANRQHQCARTGVEFVVMHAVLVQSYFEQAHGSWQGQ